MAFSSEKHKSLFPLVLFLLVFVSLTCLCQSTNTSSSNTTNKIQTTSSPSSNGTLKRIPGCKTGLNPIYR
ncbi:Protein MON2 like [Dissostichus eleginoides]|uniref:Protein MON2 like n=2 Tax=Nototheniidae TaxID=8206 RepID=A0AAD9B8I9_DISEL|nr:Protein MON2 like [Dissostichus eleginoides]